MKKITKQKTNQTLTFYVAQCMEFIQLGEYYENLTLDEAVNLYESIPEQQMHGGKGIGFVLHNAGDNENYGDRGFNLFSNNIIDVDIINSIDEFQNSSLVQQAIHDILERFPNVEVWDSKTNSIGAQEAIISFNRECKALAEEIDQFSADYDTYEYRDTVENKGKNIESIYKNLQSGETKHIIEWLQDIIEEELEEELNNRAIQLLERLDGCKNTIG